MALRRRVSVAVGGAVRLGVIESIQPVLLPGTLRYLRDHYPKLRVRPVRGRSAGVAGPGQGGAASMPRWWPGPKPADWRAWRWHPVGTREMVLIAPPDAGEASAADLLARYDWIRYDRATVTGAMAARYVHGVMPEKRSAMEFDSVIAIVAMVSAGLGVSVVQLMDPTVCDRYPVRRVRLGADAPTLQISLVSRRADEDSRVLQALTEAVERTPAARLSPAGRRPLGIHNDLEAAEDHALAVERHGVHALLEPFVRHRGGHALVARLARGPQDPREHHRLVFLALDGHGERGDLAFRHIVALSTPPLSARRAP